MDKFDPLAALEAEYTAVLAQSQPRAAPAEDPASPARGEERDAESAGSDSEDEQSAAVGGFESYALLPSSPCHSDSDAEGHERTPSFEEDIRECPQVEESSRTQQDAALGGDKRAAIMQNMQQLKLRPPPWAQAVNLTDAELVSLVQKQLGLANKPA
ncbi:unnamed protein product [Phytophthora fragariaefolia]|uniref:Unnamed protein product n=1 Tax=Phytophthora fragariaefolia TaxID=1490495 RepID=A0A9W7D5B6_9STRA|nr:unnamed protein product [Phytophthora fragariaefolia]